MRGNKRNSEAERAMFRYFEAEAKNVVVPPGEAARSAERPARPALRVLTVHAAVIAVTVGSLCMLPAGIRMETPLRQAVVTAAQEKKFLRLLPSAETLKESAEFFMNRRKGI